MATEADSARPVVVCHHHGAAQINRPSSAAEAEESKHKLGGGQKGTKMRGARKKDVEKSRQRERESAQEREKLHSQPEVTVRRDTSSRSLAVQCCSHCSLARKSLVHFAPVESSQIRCSILAAWRIHLHAAGSLVEVAARQRARTRLIVIAPKPPPLPLAQLGAAA